MPLLREGVAIGVIRVRRGEIRPFSDQQVGLLETFADQAVIAIENVRLFQALEARNRELTESLEQQTATAEILRVISSSPTDLAPVMDAVAQNAARLARADHALIGEATDGRIRWLATSGCPLVSESFPISRELPSGRAILNCQTTQVEDVAALIADFPRLRLAYDELGVRTILATPLVREGLAIGVLLVRRTRVNSFTDKEIELLRTFADQAVIAIENVRLFQELEARNRELTESLEQQTATGGDPPGHESSSPTDLQPVLDAVAESAPRAVRRQGRRPSRLVDEDVLRLGGRPMACWHAGGRMRESRSTVDPSRAGRLLDRRTVHVHDLASEPDDGVPAGQGLPAARRPSHESRRPRSCKEGVAIGVIGIRRRTGSPVHGRQIGLLEDLRGPGGDRDRERAALPGAGGAEPRADRVARAADGDGRDPAGDLSSPTDVQPVFEVIVENAMRLCDGLFSTVHRVEGSRARLVAHRNVPDSSAAGGGSTLSLDPASRTV